jgi:hypothetical protein
MKEFIEANPGLKSRFKTFIEFDDYDPEQLTSIASSLLKELQFIVPEETEAELYLLMVELHAARDKHFGNGRTARNICEMIEENMAFRLSEGGYPEELLFTVMPEDIPKFSDLVQEKTAVAESAVSKKPPAKRKPPQAQAESTSERL